MFSLHIAKNDSGFDDWTNCLKIGINKWKPCYAFKNIIETLNSKTINAFGLFCYAFKNIIETLNSKTINAFGLFCSGILYGNGW